LSVASHKEQIQHILVVSSFIPMQSLKIFKILNIPYIYVLIKIFFDIMLQKTSFLDIKDISDHFSK